MGGSLLLSVPKSAPLMGSPGWLYSRDRKARWGESIQWFNKKFILFDDIQWYSMIFNDDSGFDHEIWLCKRKPQSTPSLNRISSISAGSASPRGSRPGSRFGPRSGIVTGWQKPWANKRNCSWFMPLGKWLLIHGDSFNVELTMLDDWN